MLQAAEKCVVKMVQLKNFNEELKPLKMKHEKNVKSSSKISRLNPFLEGNRITRVECRLKILCQ